MARTLTPTTLTTSNHIYLYQLLARELGVGKQTFLPAVEEALASDRMTADDLGFASTRELLETLEPFIKLTIFKGGRIYATVIAQPAWDEALAALEGSAAKSAGAGPAAKPWKRKKAPKALKPVRPKRVKRPEPAASTEASAPETVTAETAFEATTDDDASPLVDHGATDACGASPLVDHGATDACDVAPQEASAPGEPKPAISLRVVYDPYTGVDRETTIQSHPVIPVASAAGVPGPAAATAPTSAPAPGPVTSPQPAAAPAPTAATPATSPASGAPLSAPADSTATYPAPDSAAPAEPAAPSPHPTASSTQSEPPLNPPERLATAPEVLATYPVDFSSEVYLASDRIAELCELLPYGTDVFSLLAEDYTRARTLELLSGTRARATFPLRIQHANSTDPIEVTLKKRAGTALAWELSAIR